MNRFYTLMILASAAIVFPLVFLAASCEGTPSDCKADNLQTMINDINAKVHDLTDSIKTLNAHVMNWQQITTANHLTIERLNSSLQDLNLELEYREETLTKYKSRLDSAVAIIKRQENQLKNSIYNKPK